jgi:hypothetical protein
MKKFLISSYICHFKLLMHNTACSMVAPTTSAEGAVQLNRQVRRGCRMFHFVNPQPEISGNESVGVPDSAQQTAATTDRPAALFVT